jgi:hypothetical protein
MLLSLAETLYSSELVVRAENAEKLHPGGAE